MLVHAGPLTPGGAIPDNRPPTMNGYPPAPAHRTRAALIAPVASATLRAPRRLSGIVESAPAAQSCGAVRVTLPE